MTFPLQDLPPEIVGEIAKYLGAQDVVSLGQCVNFDVSKAYHRLFPFDRPLKRYTFASFERRVNARAYQLTHKPEPIGLQEPISKICTGSDFMYFLTTEGDIWFTGNKIRATHKMMEKANKNWRFENGLVLFRSEEAYMNTDGYVTEEWKRRYPDSVRPVRRRYVDIDRSERQGSLSLVDDSGVYTCFVNDNPSESWAHYGWFGRNYYVDVAGMDGYADEQAPWLLERVLKAHSGCALYEGCGLAVRLGIGWFRDSRVMMSVLIPNTASGIKDWAVFQECVICLRTDGTVYMVRIPPVSPTREFPPDFEFSPADFDPLSALNKMGRFAQISASSVLLALVTTGGDLVRAGVFGCEVEVSRGICLTNVCSVAMTNLHWLALTNDGEVYAWGGEPRKKRCLGHGKGMPSGAVSEMVDGEEFVVLFAPTKVRLPGRAYYIAAGPGMSIVLCESGEGSGVVRVSVCCLIVLVVACIYMHYGCVDM